MVSTSSAADFHQTFQSLKSGIIAKFDGLEPQTADISRTLSTLRSQLNVALPTLPAYDQRSYDSQVKELEIRFAALRAKERPKSRFTFTSKAPVTTPATITVPRTKLRDQPVLEASNAQASTSHTISSRSRVYLKAPILDHLTTTSSTYTLTLSDLESCIIDLRPTAPSSSSQPALTALHARSLHRCILLAPIISGSAMFFITTDCLIVAGAQQFRMHESRNSTVLLNVASLPVIEHCTGLRFGGYPTSLASGVAGHQSQHRQVQDFDWVRGGISPNWRLLSDDETGLSGTILGLLDAGETTDVDGLLDRFLAETPFHA